MVVVGGKWAQVLCTPPDRKVVGARPVGSRHGLYQCVWCGGGQCLRAHITMVGAGSQGKAPHWVVVGGEKWSELPQIGSWWVRGRLVVGMGHTSYC